MWVFGKKLMMLFANLKGKIVIKKIDEEHKKISLDK